MGGQREQNKVIDKDCCTALRKEIFTCTVICSYVFMNRKHLCVSHLTKHYDLVGRFCMYLHM